MALSNKIDFLTIFSLRKMTYRNFINTGISSIPECDNLLSPLLRKMALRRHVLENWLSGIDRLRKVNVSVIESIADC
jgi:hypothetical protein